jgi:hypothetical protein
MSRIKSKARKIEKNEIDKAFHEELGIHVRIRDKELFEASKEFSEDLKTIRERFDKRKGEAYKKFESEKNDLYKKYASKVDA